MRHELDILHLLNITSRDLVEPQSINTVAFRIHITIYLANTALRKCKDKLMLLFCTVFGHSCSKIRANESA